jgi:hypothetical protein
VFRYLAFPGVDSDNQSSWFRHFVSLLIDVVPDISAHPWTLRWGADGHGHRVMEFSDWLYERDEARVTADELQELLGDGEYFSDAHVYVDELRVEFGIFDSHFLFFRGSDAQVSAVCAAIPGSSIAMRI